MIKAWEIHTVSFKLCNEEKGGMLSIKHPQKATIHTFKVKPYKVMDGVHIYEIMAFTKEEATLMEEWFKEI